MSTWSDKVNSHPFISLWKTLGNTLNGTWHADIVSSDAYLEIARAKKVYNYVDSILESSDPELTPLTTYSALQSHTTKCTAELNAFSGNKNPGHLTNANTQLDLILTVSQQLPFSTLANTELNISGSLAAYAKAIDEYTTGLKLKYESSLQTIHEKLKTIDEESSTSFQLINELKKELNTTQQIIQKQTSEFNTQFQSAEKQRAEKSDKTIEDFNTAANGLVNESKEEIDNTFSELAKKTARIIVVMDNLLEDASNVYGVTIGTLQAGAYSSYASEERKIANRFRMLAGLFMLLGVGMLIVPEIKFLLDDSHYTFDVMKVLGRLPLSLVIFVPAFYFAKESGRHRSNEILNRRRQHILSTLDPYLELMSKEKAEVIKSEVAKSIFSDSALPNNTDDGETSNLISQLANLVKQISGK